MITIELIDEAWAEFDKYKERAEQHEFITLIMIDAQFKPLYDDLHENWHVGHAFTFMKAMKRLSEKIGFKCPDFEMEAET